MKGLMRYYTVTIFPTDARTNPWLPEPWSPGKSYLGIRMIHILPQDVANMFVHMFSSKLEQLKAIIIRSIKRSWQNRWRRRAQIHKLGSEANSRSWDALEPGLGDKSFMSLAWAWGSARVAPPQEGSDSEIGISIEDETNPKVSHLRTSQRLLALTNLPQLEGVLDDARKMDPQILQLPRE